MLLCTKSGDTEFESGEERWGMSAVPYYRVIGSGPAE